MEKMNVATFYNLLLKDLKFEAKVKQDIALQQLASFVVEEKKDSIFLLKGFAGTGKTTIISSLVNNLWQVRKSGILLAPTGRAAKVIANYSGREAFTIHKKIYFPKKKSGAGVSFVLQPNKHRNGIFIVDEASMIPDVNNDAQMFENGSLLDDLIQYVYSGHNCRLILIGDTAQLPPVKLEVSPALEEQKLQNTYLKEVTHIELDEVVRQSEESDILHNATLIREALREEFYEAFNFELSKKKDVIRLVDGYEIMEAIEESYRNLGHEDTTIIVRSNKRANLYNQQIRNRILFQEEEISAGDYLMVDYPNMQPIETVVLLDTLESNNPSLTYEESNRLYQEVMKDYEEERSKYKKFMKVKNNKYFNALQIKFSYAMTCHKSQGGQWNTVFVEQPYLPNGIDRDYLRWLYTAVTRAQEKLYLIGFKDDFFAPAH